MHTEGLLLTREVDAGRRQSEVLMGPLQEALAHAGRGEIGLVIAGTGPGSYNGVRVGIASGQGIALVHRCPAVGICSLEALPVVRSGVRCLALGDARRGTFFTLEICGSKLSGVPELLGHEKFLQRVRAALEEGANLVTLEDPARLRLPEGLPGRVEMGVPSAELLLKAWVERSEAERAVLLQRPPQPFYLRPPHITTPSSG